MNNVPQSQITFQEKKLQKELAASRRGSVSSVVQASGAGTSNLLAAQMNKFRTMTSQEWSIERPTKMPINCQIVILPVLTTKRRLYRATVYLEDYLLLPHL